MAPPAESESTAENKLTKVINTDYESTKIPIEDIKANENIVRDNEETEKTFTIGKPNSDKKIQEKCKRQHKLGKRIQRKNQKNQKIMGQGSQALIKDEDSKFSEGLAALNSQIKIHQQRKMQAKKKGIKPFLNSAQTKKPAPNHIFTRRKWKRKSDANPNKP